MKFLGLELDVYKLSIRNALGTFKSTFSNLATANRTVTIPDRDFTIAGTDLLVDATTTTAGFINTSSQTFSGSKGFIGYVGVGNFPSTEFDVFAKKLKFGADYNGGNPTPNRTPGLDKYTELVMASGAGIKDCLLFNAYSAGNSFNVIFGGGSGTTLSADSILFYCSDGGITPTGIEVVKYTYKGLGIKTTPTARLHIGGSTVAPHTSPIKLTPGDVPSTAEQGAFDYDTNNDLYFTRNTTREKIAFKGDITYPTNTATSINLSTVLGTSLALTVPAGLGFISGDNYRIYSAANTANFIECSFVSYTSTTLTVLVEFARGTATFTDGILIRSSNTFSTYLPAAKAVSVTTATRVDEFSFHAEAGVLYNIKVTGSFSAAAVTTGGYIGTTSSVVPAILTGKCYVSRLQTATATELVTSMSSTTRSIVGSGNSGAGLPCAIGMDFNVRFTFNSNSYINFASGVAGSVATLLTGSSIIITRIR